MISAEPRRSVARNGGDYAVFANLTYPVLGSMRYKQITPRVDSYTIDQGQNHLRRFFTVADVLVKIRIQPRIRADARPGQQQGKEPSGGVYLFHY